MQPEKIDTTKYRQKDNMIVKSIGYSLFPVLIK
jgi:hypothetical protein